MKPGHIHIPVSDVGETVRVLESVWGLAPTFANDEMAVIPFGDIAIIFDRSDVATAATLAFDSDDCDADYQRALARGAKSIEPPTDRSWGPIRSAYLVGPGALTMEIEQVKRV